MPSDRQVKAVLPKEDFRLFHEAMEKYDLEQPELLREIVHSWIFSNMICIDCKYKNGKTRRVKNETH